MIKRDVFGEIFKQPIPTFSMIGTYYRSLGYRQVAVSGAAVGLGAIPDGTTFTLITVEGGDVRFRDDGVNPTSSIGMVVKKDGVVKYDADPAVLKAINVSDAVTLNVTFYGMGGTDA